MYIGEVTGTVVATRKTTNMDGLPLRVVRRLTTEAQSTQDDVVAVDVVGAEAGEYVLVATGSASRNTHLTDARPCDAIILAIVDTWQVLGEVKYTKA